MGTTRLETVEPLRALNAETLAALALSTLACSRTRVRASVSALTSASGSSSTRGSGGGSGGTTCSRSSTSTGSSRAVVATSAADGEVDDVVKETVLGLGDENRLVVSRSVDATETVNTSRESSGDLDVEVALRVCRGVDTLEERGLSVVERRSLAHALELLDDEV